MKLLAFDTVFEQCSVALMVDGVVVACLTQQGGRGQTEIILPMTEQLLHQTDCLMGEIKALAFNQGPGAFSGIRINTAVVQALAVATGAVCVGVSSLRVLAQAWIDRVYQAADNMADAIIEPMTITAVIDARQDEVYLGQFCWQGGVLVAMGDEQLLPYGTVITSDVVVGDGAMLVNNTKQTLSQGLMGDSLLAAPPNASDIAKLGYRILQTEGGVTPQKALPVYLRHKAWKTLAEQNTAKQQQGKK